MVSAWSVVVSYQKKGRFLCKTIRVQFGDDLRPELATFSGLYDQVSGHSLGIHEQHQRYVDRSSHTAVFAYCSAKRYWTFQYRREGFTSGFDESFDACDNYVLRSSESDGYDIVLLSTQSWFVRDDFEREIYLDPFILSCHDCGTYNQCTGKSTRTIKPLA